MMKLPICCTASCLLTLLYTKATILCTVHPKKYGLVVDNHNHDQREQWELHNVEKVGKVAKLCLQQGADNLCHVVFINDPRLEWIKEGEIFELDGWQKLTNRHNVIAIR